MPTQRHILEGHAKLKDKGDDKVVVHVLGYDRLKAKAWADSVIDEGIEDVLDADVLEAQAEADRFHTLGVDRGNLIETFGADMYHALFAELGPDERFSLMMKMLGL